MSFRDFSSSGINSYLPRIIISLATHHVFPEKFGPSRFGDLS